MALFVLPIVVLAVAAIPVFVWVVVSIVTSLIARDFDEAVIRHGVERAPAYRSKVSYALMCGALVAVMCAVVPGSIYVATLPWLLLPDRPALAMRFVQVFVLFIPLLVFEWLLVARLCFRSRVFTRFWVRLFREPSR